MQLEEWVMAQEALKNAQTIPQVLSILGFPDIQQDILKGLGKKDYELDSLLGQEFGEKFNLYFLSPYNASGIYIQYSAYKLGLFHLDYLRFLELAVLGFSIYPDYAQIETIKSKSPIGLTIDTKAILPNRWELGFVRAFESLMSEIGISHIRFRPAEEHPCYTRPSGIDEGTKEFIEHQKRMRLRYNGTANKLGYHRNREYIKEITPVQPIHSISFLPAL